MPSNALLRITNVVSTLVFCAATNCSGARLLITNSIKGGSGQWPEDHRTESWTMSHRVNWLMRCSNIVFYGAAWECQSLLRSQRRPVRDIVAKCPGVTAL